MKIVFGFILLLPSLTYALQPQFNDEEKVYLTDKPEILMCIDPNWMPYEKIDNGKHIGMTKDYMDIVSHKIGVPIILVPTTTWSQSIEYAISRKCDIFSLAMSTPERKEYMDFSDPYMSIPLVIATKIDELFIVDILDIIEKKLGVVKGYAFAELLRLKYPNINLVEVPSLDEGLAMVIEGDLFGFVGTLSSVGYSIQRQFIGELKVAGKFDEKWELGIGVRNDEPMMLAVFQRAINSLEYSEKQAILNKWVSVKYEKGIDYGLIWKILAGVSVIIIILLYRQLELRKYNRLLEKLSVTDKLTGLCNRVKIDESIQQHIDLYQRYKTKFCLLMMDLDNFKTVNDNYGHQTGDDVLIEVSSLLKSHLRKTDIIGRWGGEEFLIIIPESENHKCEGEKIAEKTRIELEESHKLQKYGVTVSIGISIITEKDDLNSIIKRADDALYKAKNEGKNKIVLAGNN